MMKRWEEPMEAAWNFLTGELFSAETGLIYDYLSSRDSGARFRYLPSPEEIAAAFPNPCGWSTGMEDCALNGGFLIDTLRLRGELGSDFAARAIRGLIRLATVHGKRGFVARGLSVVDGRSCYGNSSRDQFTLAVYGLLTGWRSREMAPALRGEAAGVLAAIADYCAAIAVPERSYDLHRLDGGRAIVSKMWACAPHEAFRLPMIFAAAYEATGEETYGELTRSFAAPGLARTLELDPDDAAWWDMPLIQMQISFSCFLAGRTMPEHDRTLRNLLRTGAGIARRKLAELLDRAERFDGRWDALCPNWRTLPMRLTAETLSADGSSALFDGRTYLNPVFPESFQRPLELIRGMGNYLGAMALAGEARPDDPLTGRLTKQVSRIDFSRSASVAPLPLVHGCLLMDNASNHQPVFTETLQMEGVGK